jgi:hypothetical protein
MKQERILTRPSARWHGSGKLLTMLIAAVTAITVLCLSGCASSRKSVSRQTAVSHEESLHAVDSTVIASEIWRTPVKVPMSSVSLTLPVDSLRLLPPGAGYTTRKGQASVKVKRKAATEKEPEQLVIEAGCDSLELVAASYSKTINTLKRQLKEAKKANSELKETAKERTSPCLGFILIAFIVGVATGIVLTILTKKYGKKCFRRN